VIKLANIKNKKSMRWPSVYDALYYSSSLQIHTHSATNILKKYESRGKNYVILHAIRLLYLYIKKEYHKAS